MVDLEDGRWRALARERRRASDSSKPSATAFPIRSWRAAWNADPLAVRARRKELGVTAVFNRVDTCAAEFESFTPYLYSSYESACEADADRRARKS